MDLDLYVYIKQEKPTVIPSNVVGQPGVEAESLAVWGFSAGEVSAIGGALVLTTASQASSVYGQIPAQPERWTKLSDRTIYFVYGTGSAAEALKTAINNQNFKYYDDEKGLSAVRTLPNSGSTKLAGVMVARPDKPLIGNVIKETDPQAFGMVDMIIKVARLEVIAGGLYSPDQINVGEVTQAFEKGTVSNLNAGILITLNIGLPGFAIEPIVGKLLTENQFTKVTVGNITVYKGVQTTSQGEKLSIAIRVEGSTIFAALSGKEAYAETLVTGVKM